MNLQVSLPSKSGGITFKNPIMPAAATFGNIIEYKPYVDLSSLGALIPNSIFIDTGTPTKAKKTCKTRQGFLSALSRNNISIREFEETILPQLPFQETPVIIDMKASDKFEMEELAAYINTIPGISGIEINLNCPYGGKGLPYWKQGKEELHDLVKRVRRAAPSKFLFAKSPGGCLDPNEIAKICADAGADAFTSFCNMNGMSLNIRTRKFRCGSGGSGGFSGPALKPMCLSFCYKVINAVDIPVIGVGGICTAEDVLEYIMAGAAAVQVGSANLSRPDLMPRILEDLVVLMEQLGIASLDEIRGTASPE